MEIESRFRDIARVAEANGGRIIFVEKLEALLRYWYKAGIEDAGSIVWEGDPLRIVREPMIPPA